MGSTPPTDRIQLLDALRGFALLGILLVNFESGSSNPVAEVIYFLAEDSFYPIFSLLFGMGFMMQMARSAPPSAARYAWRSALLFAIGALHGVLVWRGDILKIYAVLSLFLLPVRRWRPGSLLAAAAIVLAFSLLPSSIVPRPTVGPPDQEAVRIPQAVCQALPGLSETYRRDVCRSMVGTWSLFRSLPRWYARADVLAMFLLGAYIGRRQIVVRPAEHLRLLTWTAGVGLVLGVASNTLAVLEVPPWLRDAVGEWWRVLWLGNYGLGLFYLSGLTWLWVRRPRVRRWLEPLASAGRMTLTNYLLQSVVFVRVMPRSLVDGWWNVPVLLMSFALQVVVSRWWLTRFQYGPFEWVWRSLTWWQMPPMRAGR